MSEVENAVDVETPPEPTQMELNLSNFVDAIQASNFNNASDLFNDMLSSKVDDAIEAEIKPYLSAAPGAVARSKRLTRMLGPEITQLKIEATIEALADAWDDAEAHEGVAAFFEKRKPNWKT